MIFVADLAEWIDSHQFAEALQRNAWHRSCFCSFHGVGPCPLCFRWEVGGRDAMWKCGNVTVKQSCQECQRLLLWHLVNFEDFQQKLDCPFVKKYQAELFESLVDFKRGPDIKCLPLPSIKYMTPHNLPIFAPCVFLLLNVPFLIASNRKSMSFCWMSALGPDTFKKKVFCKTQ